MAAIMAVRMAAYQGLTTPALTAVATARQPPDQDVPIQVVCDG
jgi:hypothetical protein